MDKVHPNNDSLTSNKLDALIVTKDGVKATAVPKPSFVRSMRDILYEYAYVWWKLGSSSPPRGESVLYNYIEYSSFKSNGTNVPGRMITSDELNKIDKNGRIRIVGISDTHERHDLHFKLQVQQENI